MKEVAAATPVGISAAAWMRSVCRGPRSQVTVTGDATDSRSCSLSGARGGRYSGDEGGPARRSAPRQREEPVDELHDEVVGVVGCHSMTLS